MKYCIRVEFPDEDKYTFVTFNEGMLKGTLRTWPERDYDKAVEEAKKYPHAYVLELK